MNILIKLTSIVALVIAPYIAVDKGIHEEHSMVNEPTATEIVVDQDLNEVVENN